jgi:signal peptidase
MKIPLKKKQKNKIPIWLSRVFIAIAALVVGFNLYQWNSQSLVGDSLPMPFGVGVSVVLSGSMEPELSVNDLVFIAEEENYSEGDVVVYQRDGELIIHRIIAVNGEEVVTQGDANSVADSPVKITNIKGKMIMSVPYLGLIVRWIKTPIGTIVVLLLAVALMELSFRKKKQQDTKEMESIIEEIKLLKQQNNKKD